MKIDITQEPPADIFRNKGNYVLLIIASLVLMSCGLGLAAYIILSDTPPNGKLEMVAFAIIVGSVPIFSYSGEKLQAYKRLTSDQMKELADWSRKHPEINTFCALVAKAGRQPIMAEYEACQALAEDVDEKKEFSK